jgi:pimeloyl-ACP methyl ester carboxylesterase
MTPSFPQFESHLRTLYAEGKLREIIAQIDERREDFPDERLFLSYWQIGMAARLDDPELAFQFLDDLIDQGLWINQVLLKTSPSLENLQGHPEYEGRLREMAVLQQREIRQLVPLLTLRQEDRGGSDANPRPLLIGLHAGRSLSLKSIPFWQVPATHGWLVGVPQSSQALWSQGYVWDDPQITRDEIDHHMHGLMEKYTVDRRRIILAGHRNGGEIAALLPVSGGIDTRGFIAIGPTGALMDDPDQWARILKGRPPRGLRGVILLGERDPAPRIAEIRRIMDIFNINGLPTLLEIIPGVGGDYEPDYDQAILRAIDFVLS